MPTKKSSDATRKRSERPAVGSKLLDPCDPVTAEEFHFAHVAAHAAANGKTPRKSFASLHEDAVSSGKLDPRGNYLFLTDAPENHAAFAIMDAFPEKTPQGEQRRRSLLWRVMFASDAVFNDKRAKRYLRKNNGQNEVARPLIEALASTPMRLGGEIPADEIFANAAGITALSGSREPHKSDSSG